MERMVKLGTWEPALARNAVEGREAITPNKYAAAALGVRHCSLDLYARRVLGEGRIVHPIVALRLLRDVMGDPPRAGEVLPALKELLRAGAREGLAGSDRARRLVGTVVAYQGKLRDLGLVDSAEALREVASSPPARSRLLVWGYPRLGSDEVELVDAVAGDGSEVYLPCGEEPIFAENRRVAEELSSRGWTVVEVGGPQGDEASSWRSTASRVEAREYADLESEVRGVLTEVKDLIVNEGVGAEDVALVVRDEALYGPTVIAVAREYGVDARVFYRVPVDQGRVGAWVAEVLEAAGGEDREGETESSEDRSEKASWAAFRAGLSSLSEDWPSEDVRERWAERLIALLSSMRAGAHAVVPLDAYEKEAPRLLQDRAAFEAVEEVAGLFAGAGPGDEALDLAGFVEEVRGLLGAVTVPAYPGDEGVALHTPLGLYGASYRYVFVLGLVDGAFPEQIVDDPILDFHERAGLRRAGVAIETASDRARRERLSFWTMLQAPEGSLSLSYPKNGKDRANLPSPYFELLGANPSKPAVGKRPASLEEARRAYLSSGRTPAEIEGDPVLRWARRSHGVEVRREGTTPFDEFDGVVGTSVDLDGRKFSATQLSDLAKCGFKWWAGNVLRLHEPAETVEVAVLGSFYHKVLEFAASKAKETGRRLEEHLEGTFEEAEALHHKEGGLVGAGLLAWEGRRAEHLEMLRTAVTNPEFAVDGAKVGVGLEEPFEGDWRGFWVSGFVDRVDEIEGSGGEGDGVVLVDYKSGTYTPVPDVQLTIYRETAAPKLFKDKRVLNSYYYSLKGAKRMEGDKLLKGTKLDDLVEGLKTKLREGRLAPDIFEGGLGEKACAFCSFDPVCRKGPRLKRKLGSGGVEGEHE